MSSLNYMDLCRLCLVKEQVSVPIFDGEGDVRQIFIKITTCLPVKVSKEDSLPKKICSNCVYRVENSFEFWNTTVSAEKQLLQWLGDSSNERKLSPSTVSSNADQETVMETEQLVLKEERLEHDQSESLKSTGRAAAGGATPALIEQVAGAGTGAVSEEEDEDESEDGEEAAGNDSEESAEEDVEEPANKEEVESEEEEEDEPYEELEPTTFVNVSLACDEAGPSGMQQQSEGSDPKQTQSRMKAELAVAATAATSSEEPSTSASAPSTSGLLLLAVRRPSPRMLSAETLANLPKVPNATNLANLPKVPNATNIANFLNVQNLLSRSNLPTGGLQLHRSDTSGSCVINPKQFLYFQLQKSALASTCTQNMDLTPTERNQLKSVQMHKHKTLLSCNMSDQSIDQRSTVRNCVQDLSQSVTTEPDLNGGSQLAQKLTEVPVSNSSDNTVMKKLTFVRKLEPITRCIPCKLCNVDFRTQISFNKHMKKVHNVLRMHTCKLCNKSFRYLCHLNSHMKIHERPKEYVCDICGYAAIQLCNLKSHRMRHFREYKFKCDICGQGFYYNSQLKQHHYQHSKERLYVCKVCPLSWKTMSSLTIHMRTQHPELYKNQQFFECEICGEKFVLKQLLSKHKRRRHAKDKCPNLCDLCGRSFTSSVSLRSHQKSHRGEKSETCDVCGKSFVARRYLRLHARTHTGEKPYTCEHCGKSFTQHCSIVIHMRYHTGERPYKCPICGSCFVSRSVLNQHQKSTHHVRQWNE